MSKITKESLSLENGLYGKDQISWHIYEYFICQAQIKMNNKIPISKRWACKNSEIRSDKGADIISRERNFKI